MSRSQAACTQPEHRSCPTGSHTLLRSFQNSRFPRCLHSGRARRSDSAPALGKVTRCCVRCVWEPPAAPHRAGCPVPASLLVGDEAGAALGMCFAVHGATAPCQADSPSAMTAHGEKQQQQQGKNREKSKIRISPLEVVCTLFSPLSEPRKSPVNNMRGGRSLSFWQ